jgi:hypothetical protein
MAQAVSRRSPTTEAWVRFRDVGFVVDKVALGQVFLRVLRFSPVNFIPPVLHYSKKRKELIIIITGLHNKPQGCGASVASAAGPFITKKKTRKNLTFLYMVSIWNIEELIQHWKEHSVVFKKLKGKLLKT